MMKRFRVVFMGTPEFAVPCLSMLAQHTELLAVVTQPDKPRGRGQKFVPSPVKAKAIALGVPVLQPARVKTPEFAAQLAALAPDLMVVVAYGKILSQELLDIPKYGCINVHASLLPRYRGAAPMQWCVINGEKETGVTTMQHGRGARYRRYPAPAPLPPRGGYDARGGA
jgi:methionyl-tRNA formyltransferase